MPLFFLLTGVLLVIVGINDKVSDLVTLLKDDFAPSDGQPSFILWILIIGLVGLLGGIKSFKSVSNAFLLLLVIVVLLANKGFITKFTDAIKQA